MTSRVDAVTVAKYRCPLVSAVSVAVVTGSLTVAVAATWVGFDSGNALTT